MKGSYRKKETGENPLGKRGEKAGRQKRSSRKLLFFPSPFLNGRKKKRKRMEGKGGATGRRR